MERRNILFRGRACATDPLLRFTDPLLAASGGDGGMSCGSGVCFGFSGRALSASWMSERDADSSFFLP